MYTATVLAFVGHNFIHTNLRYEIEPFPEIQLRSASHHNVQFNGMIKLYIRIQSNIIPFYFGMINDLPLKISVGTSFISKHIETINPHTKTIRLTSGKNPQFYQL